jgi:hypothetical protein
MMSDEALQRFERILSEFNASLARQEEIVSRVFEMEADIANLRIGYLDDYFDAYSSGLNKVATKTSDIGEQFLILENQFSKVSEELAATSGSSKKSGGRQRVSSRYFEYRSEPNEKDVKTGNTLPDEVRKKKPKSQKGKADLYAEYLTNTSEANRVATEKGSGRTAVSNAAVKKAVDAQIKSLYESQEKHATSLHDKLIALQTAEYDFKENKELQLAKLTDLRLSKQLEATNAALDTQNLFNDISTELAYMGGETIRKGDGGKDVNEAGEVQAMKINAEERKKSLEDEQARRLKFIQKQELAARRKNNGVLSAEESTRILKEAAQKFKLDEKNLEKLTARRAKLEAAKANAAERQELRDGMNTMRTAETFEERKQALYNLTHNDAGEVDKGKVLSAAMLAVSDLAKQLEGTIDNIASFKGPIDTRLQGSSSKTFLGSYWDQLVRDMTSVGVINPFFKQETFANNIKNLVEKGISFDLKQRAFLMTIQDKIANTFDVADGTLLRLVRIQQEDSTAGRLGMESALNAFLNEMYETSEYLSGVAAGVRNSLQEMEALMQGAEAAEVEYQVQKWLGSLYSVGMSQDAVTGISNALGQIAAGQVEGLTGGGAGNLLIMAANDAGLSIADILTDGISSSDTNKLLQAAVNYLAELADSAKDNKIVQQQLANVFGVKASDLRAATNLVLPGTTKSVYGSSMSYGNMLSQLSKMAGSMGSRTSVAEMMTNFWENGKYSLAGSMASNPVSYFIYKMAKVVDDAAGGIDLPFLNVMGFGVDLNTTVSDLMRVAAVGAGLLGSIGPMISGLGSSFSGRAMLDKLGIGSGSGLAITPRGDGGSSQGSTGGGAKTTSESGYAGNASGSDIKDSTIQESEDSKKQQMIEAKEEEESNKVDVLNTTVLKIYELLDDVANGGGSFKVKIEGYGLTKAGGSGSGSGALAGVSALNSSSGGSNSSSGTAGSGVNSGGVSGSIDLGGWTMI